MFSTAVARIPSTPFVVEPTVPVKVQFSTIKPFVGAVKLVPAIHNPYLPPFVASIVQFLTVPLIT